MAAKTPAEGMDRRDFVKKAVYIAPAILTLTAAPAFAKAGSYKDPHISDDRRYLPENPPHRPGK